MDRPTPREWEATPRRIAVLYLAFGLAGLVLSDLILPRVLGGRLLRTVQGVKGVVEVLLTAGFVYLVVRLSWQDLYLKERAMDEAPVGITISDPDREDNPLIFANREFERITGYGREEAVGRNCRFLQGEETDPRTRARVREAIENGESISVDIRNYRKNGEMFWNKLDIAPVRDGDGTVTNYVGFQTDITERKITEERLTVLNRVLRHNCRNRLTVIRGYLSLLRDEVDGETAQEAVEGIDDAADEFLSLVEGVRDTERVLQSTGPGNRPVALGDRVRETVDAYRARYPDATVTLSLPEAEDVPVEARGLPEAIEEAVGNALEHADSPDPTVSVRVSEPRDGWVEVEVDDDGPGIPEEELTVLREGETPLAHGTHLGLWMIQWVVNQSGGTLTVSTDSASGTTLTITVPTASSAP